MELDKALERLSEIHAHVARGEIFRGYRAVPIGITSLVAVAAALLQARVWAPVDAHGFVVQWVVAAAVCATICAWDLWSQGRLSDPATSRRRTWPVVQQYVPAIAAGALLAIALADTEHAGLLPGLWALVHGLGILASRPFLPRAVGWVALWFFAAGGWLLLGVDHGSVVPDPWSVGATFGLGQALLAAVLHADVSREGSAR